MKTQKASKVDDFLDLFKESNPEALEFFEFNTIGAWMGEGTPCFATTLDEIVG